MDEHQLQGEPGPARTKLARPRPEKGRGALSNPQNRYDPRTRDTFDDGWASEEEPGPARPRPEKGRGALSNPQNRYDPRAREAFDDGWASEEEPGPPVPTTILKEATRTIITSNKSPDIPFEYSINPYKGCEHGCIYCYARPTHAYWDLSPGLDFETKIIAKPDAARLLREKLEQPSYQVKPICIGANTDAYQPIESKLKITRSIIEVLAEFRHPFSMITKSSLILRDLDLLAPLAEKKLFSAAVSVTTLDRALKRILEPRAPAGRVRLETIKALNDAGVQVTLLAAPMIPYVNDHELEEILAGGHEAGATSANYILLRLPLEISGMFRDWLDAHFPERAQKIMSIIRQSRGGKDYRAVFGERMTGTGEFAKLIHNRWSIACRKLGYGGQDRFALDPSQFKRTNQQLTLI